MIIMKILKILLKSFLLFNGFIFFFLLVFKFIYPATSAFIYSNNSEQIKSIFYDDIKYIPISINNISLYLPLAVVASGRSKIF